MEYKIDWKNLKNGYKGFESLAVKYVQIEYNSNFKHTKDTRDGNKDAVLEKEIYTIIFGYQPSKNIAEEWWMEAKYSESKKVLPRYRLDATLVSAILKGNVTRIIFVTNMNIESQTINDIRQAIVGVTLCHDVNFCTRSMLEYWLYQNPDILYEFFSNYHNEPIVLDDLVLIDNIKYYSAMEVNYAFQENIRVLDLEQIYYANFSVFSKYIQTVKLQSSKNIIGIKIVSSKKVILQKGINNLQFSFVLKKNYGYKSKKKKQEHMHLPEPAFLFGTLQIISEYNVTINKHVLANYEIISQKNVTKEINAFFTKADNIKGTSLFYLYGQSGVGKSHVLSIYIRSKKPCSCPCFYCEMSGNYQQDLKNLVDCINYIYFPFLPSEDITVEYLEQMENNNYFPPFYQELIVFRHDEIQLSKLLVRYISENIALFPKILYVNQRQIIIDNIHKTTNTIINVLYKIVIEQSIINASFQIIFSGQWIQHTSIYIKLCQTINVKEKELFITADDCLSLLPNHSFNDKIKIFFATNQLFSNTIELLIFSLYLQDNNKVLHSFENFQILYHLFFLENIMETYLKHIFDNVMSNDEKIFQLCNQVYWNTYGMPRTDTEEEHKLLCYHVVKLDSTAQRIIPYHDLYTKCYRKNYVCNQISNIPLVQLLDSNKYADIKAIASKLHEEYLKKNYILVYYTLEPLFKEGSSTYRCLMDDTTYFTLFQDFAHSCTFCSIDYSGGILFKQIYNETKFLYNSSPQIRLIHNAALWELTNSTFESLKYEQALNLCQELLIDTKQLVAYNILNVPTEEDHVRYHNINVIKSMIKSEMLEKDSKKFFLFSEQKMIEHKQENRLWSFRVRYSLTLMGRNPYEVLELLQKCHNHYKALGNENEKYYLWSCFYISYMKMILNEDATLVYKEETQALSILEKLKNSFFNDYRKMMYGIILYLYYRNRKDEADLYLLKDCYVLREKRPRLKGFEHLILALRYVMEGENLMAYQELKDAYAIFKHIPSYSKIIKHNIDLIEKNNQKIVIQTQYYFGGIMEKDTYYLDIRGCW